VGVIRGAYLGADADEADVLPALLELIRA